MTDGSCYAVASSDTAVDVSDKSNSSTTPAATVQRMFAAFSASDLDALLETVHPESRWTYYGANPRLAAAACVGRDNVRRFFEGNLARLTMTEFNTTQFVAEGDTVAIFGSEAGTVRETGQPFRNVWAKKKLRRRPGPRSTITCASNDGSERDDCRA